MDIDRITGAVTGSVVAGLALSAVMLAGEKITGKPSELIERKAAAKLGISTPAGDATGLEQLITHGGHLALSALAGPAYAGIVDEKADGVKSGAAFGFAFFVAAYGLAGPFLGVTPASVARVTTARSSAPGVRSSSRLRTKAALTPSDSCVRGNGSSPLLKCERRRIMRVCRCISNVWARAGRC